MWFDTTTGPRHKAELQNEIFAVLLMGARGAHGIEKTKISIEHGS